MHITDMSLVYCQLNLRGVCSAPSRNTTGAKEHGISRSHLAKDSQCEGDRHVVKRLTAVGLRN